MDIYLFHQDLQQYSDSDILKIAKMYDLSGNVNDLRWMVALKNSETVRGRMITGDQYIDQDIIKQMDDSSLLQFCNTSKINRLLCDPIWKERVAELGYDGELAPAKDWQQLYVLLSKHKKVLKEGKDITIMRLTGDVSEYFNILNGYLDLGVDAIKLNAINVIRWLLDNDKISVSERLVLEATFQCKKDILKLLLSINNPHIITITDLNEVAGLGCLDTLKVWNDMYGKVPNYKGADTAFEIGHHHVLFYLAEHGILPGTKSVRYAIKNNMLDGLKWLIDNGVRVTDMEKRQISKKPYGDEVLRYIASKDIPDPTRRSSRRKSKN